METEKSYRLNVFALPNQTTILFGLIVIVLIGTVVAGNFGGAPLFMVTLALGLVFLPLRAFLAWPERELKKYKFKKAGSEFDALCELIAREATAIGLSQIPKLVISENNVPLHIFGSFKRYYIGLSRHKALDLQAELGEKPAIVQALFIHELYHFKNGDYWQIGYTRELLRITVLFTLWTMAFLLGIGLNLVVAKPYVLEFDFSAIEQLEMPSPIIKEAFLAMFPPAEAWAEMQTQFAKIDMGAVLSFALNATYPFILIGGILWLFYWRKLHRIREFYADAGVIQTQKQTKHLPSALMLISIYEAEEFTESDSSLQYRLKRSIVQWLQQLWKKAPVPTFVRQWLSLYPCKTRRIKAWQNPLAVYDPWWTTALSLGSLALLLDIMLATPLALPYYGQWPMHFSVLVISVIITLALITPLVLKNPVRKSMLKITSVIVGLRFAWLVLTIGLLFFMLIFAPNYLSNILDSTVQSIARYPGFLTEPVFDDLTAFVIEASWINTAQVFVLLGSLIVLIGANLRLLRRLLTWYGYPNAEHKLLKTGYRVIAATTAFFALTILNPVTTALLRWENLLNPLGIIFAFLGAVIIGIAAFLFIKTDRKYAHRCSQCAAFVPGHYYLGKTCEKCGQLLHPWMIMEYEA